MRFQRTIALATAVGVLGLTRCTALYGLASLGSPDDIGVGGLGGEGDGGPAEVLDEAGGDAKASVATGVPMNTSSPISLPPAIDGAPIRPTGGPVGTPSPTPDAADGAQSTGSADASEEGPDGSSGDTGARVDAGQPLGCDPSKPFGAPVAVTELRSSSAEGALRLTPDELTGVFWSARPGGPSTINIYGAKRSNKSSPFGAIALLANAIGADEQFDPTVTADDLMLVFSVYTSGAYKLMWSSRATTSDAFAGASPATSLNTSHDDHQPFLSSDGSLVYFSSDRSGQSEIYEARASEPGVFGAPTVISELSIAGYTAERPVVSADGLTIFLSSNRPGGKGKDDIWVASRASTASGFSSPVALAQLNSSATEVPDWISPDGCRLYLDSDRSGGGHIYLSARSP
jgi:WD40-like Beta Propeller Repeat